MKRPKNIPHRLIPRALRSGGSLRSVAAVVSHLLQDYGWLRSMREKKVVDATGVPIPGLPIPRSTISVNSTYPKKRFLNGEPVFQPCFGHRGQRR
jgi:hypothetical protein